MIFDLIGRLAVTYINFVASIGVYLAVAVFCAAGNSTITTAVLALAQRGINALTQSLSGVVLIVKSIFTNETSPQLIRYLVNHLYELLTFTYDLIRPSGVITTGVAGEAPVNPFWELDPALKENRQAISAQVQRVLLSIRNIIFLGTQRTIPKSLADVPMNIRLASDFDASGKPPSPIYVAGLNGGVTAALREEKWIYINGIGNERVWFESACRKLRDAFNREITGVYNRSDGILWDMIQCFGEHSTVGNAQGAAADNSLIQRTESSVAAQRALEDEIRKALWPADGSVPPKKVVLVCHSQGCLLTRLTLQALVQENAKGSQRRADMRERLRVFPFANPSMDWCVSDNGVKFLGNYAHTTEHFAHKVDFVAMLGVVSHMADPKSGFDNETSEVFLSKGGVGHLFGAHYSLDPGDYENSEGSKLFNALGGVPIA
ncbi:uncharacterized protein B0I36DRAFT_261324 [Microdochium trichocladiopsis]|uniref:Alpha/Beta hydrolase protein n=1 Tax=Microdochium trichocladiopsis TaxID=1682393 RepID=A0A9P8YJ97_9PEZI|nr:uncharacterized protein B0I36DRAFT_261324 [Microdochium trichocladiopsis]KAH7041526.1 hypothetical protein B0I36DRAFT_261324 [Microdochium trichocladiopsis]